jgi:Mg2+-importing ATPase
MSAVIMMVGITIPFTAVGTYFGFTSLSSQYWPMLGLTLICYVVLTQLVKTWLLQKKWI